MIVIALDNAEVMAGSFLTGRVDWTSEDGDAPPSEIIVAAEWKTEGKGNRARGLGRAARLTPRHGMLSFPIRLLLPHEGPISWSGELITIQWKLMVRAVKRGFDEFAELEFRVVPRRRKLS